MASLVIEEGGYHQRIDSMFERALGRKPSPEEVSKAEDFVRGLDRMAQDAGKNLLRLEARYQRKQAELTGLVAPVRSQILQGRRGARRVSPVGQVQADSVWLFEDGVEDAKGSLHGEIHGNARIEGGALILDGVNGSHVSTAPLSANIKGKTLEAWVQLADLEQRGGGVISIQDLRGGLFDAIVFAEREARRWMAGSNRGLRSQSFRGLEELEAIDQPVHLAIVYRMDGRIEAYRNGKPYGSSYQSDGPAAFERGQAQILFGNRHGAPTGNHLFKGKIFEARLYSRALTPQEIETSGASFGNFLTERELDAALSPAQRSKRRALQSEIQGLENEIEAARGLIGDRNKSWQDLAHAIFNFKEFIYIK